ncbi:hypothetical protein [Bizionia sp.]|uniref:hypothetical protein n=1 Tax=Bizionia sp. TaxID=1954480 RepID=UPI003A94A4E1
MRYSIFYSDHSYRCIRDVVREKITDKGISSSISLWYGGYYRNNAKVIFTNAVSRIETGNNVMMILFEFVIWLAIILTCNVSNGC